jgi:hypothetical protein
LYKVSPKFAFAIEAIGIDLAGQHPDWLTQIMAWDIHSVEPPPGPTGEDLRGAFKTWSRQWDRRLAGYSAGYLQWLWILGVEAVLRLPEGGPDGQQAGEVHIVPFSAILRPSPNLIIIGADQLNGGEDVDRVLARLDAAINEQGSGHG